MKKIKHFTKIVYYISYLCLLCLFSFGGYILEELMRSKSNTIEVGLKNLISPSIFGFFCWVFLIMIGEIKYKNK